MKPSTVFHGAPMAGNGLLGEQPGFGILGSAFNGMRRKKKLAIACGVLAVGVAIALLCRGQDRSPSLKDAPNIRSDRAPRSVAGFRTAPVELPDAAVELPRLSDRIEPIDDPWDATPDAPNRQSIGIEPLFANGFEPATHDNAWRPSTKAPPLSDEEMGHLGNAAARIHRVQKGDTLPSLAARYLGSSERFWDLYVANRDQLSNPDELPVGIELRIPREKPIAPTISSPTMDSPLAPVSHGR